MHSVNKKIEKINATYIEGGGSHAKYTLSRKHDSEWTANGKRFRMESERKNAEATVLSSSIPLRRTCSNKIVFICLLNKLVHLVFFC